MSRPNRVVSIYGHVSAGFWIFLFAVWLYIVAWPRLEVVFLVVDEGWTGGFNPAPVMFSTCVV